MDSLLAHLSDSIAAAQSLEDLTRPLLEMLEAVSGFESTYLTLIDFERGVQKILFSRNVQELLIPEGLTVSWDDTLCKRALDEGRLYTGDVAACWGDSDAARQLGIQSYVSAPVVAHGSVYGTLCAASSAQRPLPDDAQKILKLFSRLIAQHVEREQLLERLKHANMELAAMASTDQLTGLPNRRLLLAELTRSLARGKREGSTVPVDLVDLDGFKRINDQYGHDAGDAFLAAISRRLQAAVRATDLIARLGGDEFAVVGPGPTPDGDPEAAARNLARRLTEATVGQLDLGTVALDYAGASVGIVAIAPDTADAEGALKQADAAMYQVKRERQAGPGAAVAPRS
jgi:diguanylate cyclase